MVVLRQGRSTMIRQCENGSRRGRRMLTKGVQMESATIQLIDDFKFFLENAGLTLDSHEVNEMCFGNTSYVFIDENMYIKLCSDRGIWFIEMAGAASPKEWFDAALLRDLRFGPGDDILSLSDQVEFFKTNWEVISRSFEMSRRIETFSQLRKIRAERAKRRFPGLYP